MLHDIPVFFRAVQRRGLLSVSAESSQRPCAWGGGRTNVVFVRLPCDARRTAAAPNSHIHVLEHAALAPPFGCASRHRQRRVCRFDAGHPWPQKPLALPRPGL